MIAKVYNEIAFNLHAYISVVNDSKNLQSNCIQFTCMCFSCIIAKVHNQIAFNLHAYISYVNDSKYCTYMHVNPLLSKSHFIATLNMQNTQNMPHRNVHAF